MAMRNILDTMGIEDVRQFVNGKAFKYIKDYLNESTSAGVDLMLTLTDANQMFSLQGEISTGRALSNLLNAFSEVVNPTAKKPEEVPTHLSNYQSQKPKELTDPVVLP
jgi:hypothetical protein